MKKKIVLVFDLGQICNDMLAKCNLIGKSIKDEAMADIKASIVTPDDPETRCIVNRAMTEAFGKVKRACQRYLTVGRTEDDNRLERLVKSIIFAKEETEVRATDDEGHELWEVYLKGASQPYSGYPISGDTFIVGKQGETLSIQEMDINSHLMYDLWIEYETQAYSGYRIDENSWNVNGATVYQSQLTREPIPRMTEVAGGLEFTSEQFTLNPEPLYTTELVDTDEIVSIDYEKVTLVLAIDNFNLAVTDDLKSSIHKFVVDYVMGEYLKDQHAEKSKEYKSLAEDEDYSNIIKDLNARDNYTMRRPSFM